MEERKSLLLTSKLVVYVCSTPDETTSQEDDFIGHNMFHDEFYSLHHIETHMQKCVDITFDVDVVSCCHGNENQSPSEENSDSFELRVDNTTNSVSNKSERVPVYCLLDEYAQFLRTVFRKLDDDPPNNKPRASQSAPFRLANQLLFWLFCNFHALRANLKLTRALHSHRDVLHSSEPLAFDYYNSRNLPPDNRTNNRAENPTVVAATGDPPASAASPVAPTSPSSSLIFE